MADNERPEDDEAPPIPFPSRAPLPPPPDIQFTRPTLDRRAPPARPNAGGTPSAPQGTDGGGHGAGMAAGFSFVASTLAGVVAGGWIDRQFNHTGTPWGVMGMSLAGLGVGLFNMFKLLGRGSRGH